MLYFLNFTYFMSYCYILRVVDTKRNDYYCEKNLIHVIVATVFSTVVAYNCVSYFYNKNYYVFSEADAVTYYRESLIMAEMSFKGGVDYFLLYKNLDDLGMVLLCSMLYRLWGSILFLNVINIVFGLVTALCIFKICLNFMHRKYAFICTIAYSTSSFVVWFHSSGLKESFMCMLIVLFFYKYYKYLNNRYFSDVVSAIILLLANALFRPAIIFFGLAAIATSYVLEKRKKTDIVLMLILVFAVFVFLKPMFRSVYDRFARGGDYGQVIRSQESEGMVKGGVKFTLTVNFLAQLIGPLPTISTDTKTLLSFFASGLIYKVLLSVFFWFGCFYIFRMRVESIYPIVIFALFEMIALMSILEGLELRKSMPHFSMIYIVAFWFIDKLESGNNFLKVKEKRIFKITFGSYSIFAFIVIMVWNLRFSILK